ncbi:hypothetical protein FKP32DRAFT_940035 [Trametes sanguinea]|nr:hypothetical protein FKP32DRAFT_940035 [Trametes sanguinea]
MTTSCASRVGLPRSLVPSISTGEHAVVQRRTITFMMTAGNSHNPQPVSHQNMHRAQPSRTTRSLTPARPSHKGDIVSAVTHAHHPLTGKTFRASARIPGFHEGHVLPPITIDAPLLTRALHSSTSEPRHGSDTLFARDASQ